MSGLKWKKTGVNFTNLMAQSANAPYSFTNKKLPNHHYAQLENTLNFYALHPALYTNKFSINLLAQKLPIEC